MREADALGARARSLLGDERDPVANAANLCALIYGTWSGLNWAGFYFVRGGELVLGPFQGKPAVTRIAHAAGVCGTAWAQGRTIVVPDVHAFAGHIACDGASESEIVVPLVRDGRIVGVLDLDSPELNRFTATDARELESLAALYISSSNELYG